MLNLIIGISRKISKGWSFPRWRLGGGARHKKNDGFLIARRARVRHD
jgi:hypothetical protein